MTNTGHGRDTRNEQQTPQVLENLSDEECALFAILSDPTGLDQAEFLWSSESDGPDGCFRAWPFQWRWWRDRSPLQIDQSARSIGKALDVATPIPTPKGWTPIGDLSAGDIVYDENGNPCQVTAAFEPLTRRACREVLFDDGSAIVADVDHQWLTWDALQWKAHRRGRVTNGPAVRTTGQIEATIRYRDEANHRVPVASPLTGGHVDTPLSPYMIGYWLGDGHSAQGRITVGPQDIENVQRILDGEGYRLVHGSGCMEYKVLISGLETQWEDLPALATGSLRPAQSFLTNGDVRELRVRARQGEPLGELANRYGVTRASVTQLVRGQFRRGAGGPVRGNAVGNEFVQHLTALNLLRNKHIPAVLLRAGLEQRVALLQGLMDSDGHCTKIGRCEITLKNETLARGVFELLTSLGQRVFFEKRDARCNGVDAGVVYRVGFNPVGIEPFRLDRKAVRVRIPARWSDARLTQRRIVAVREVPSRSVRCITVDSPNHLYLAGEAMIPTHNSESIKVRACAFPFVHPGQEMVVTAPELVHLEPIVTKVESQMYATRTLREMLVRGRSGVTHRPFQMNFQNQARIIGRIPQKDGKGIKGCAGENELILTDQGLVRAADLVVGDQVLTDQGRYKPILEVHHDVNDCYEVRGQQSFPLTVSCDHRFLVADNEDGPKRKRRLSAPLFVDVEALDENYYWASPTVFPELPVPECNDLELHNEFWWLIGRYLADGVLTNNGHALSTIHWYAPDRKADALLAAADILSLHMNRASRAHSTADDFTVYNRHLAAWIETHFGRRADGKRLPAFTLGMPEQHRQHLLEGYLAGDGHFDQTRKRWSVGSASKTLVAGVQLLAQSLGYTVNCTSAQPNTTEINGVRLKNKPKISWRLQISDHGHPIQIGDHRYAKIGSVTPVGKQPIVNIVVADDHSFIAGSIVSHNVHPVWLEMDEAQDYGHAGWVELTETLKRGVDGAVWRAHGVTRGVRDDFYKVTQPSPTNPWKVHRYPAMYRPNWTDEERDEKIKQYGSRDDPDYRRNVLGFHGDATQPLFVLTRLMAAVDDDLTSGYNTDEYALIKIKNETLSIMEQDVLDVVDFPRSHLTYAGSKANKAVYWVGMDIGMTRDPSEILVFVEHRDKPTDQQSRLKLLTRIQMVRVGVTDQTKAILKVIDFYHPRVFAMDRGGLGLPFVQLLKEWNTQPDLRPDWADLFRVEDALDRIKGYNFGEKIVVDFDPAIELAAADDPRLAGMRRNTKEYGIDKLRELVDTKRLVLPWDEELLGEFQGGTVTNASGLDQYGRKRFCVDMETEALTRRGWIRGDALKPDDELWTMNPDSRGMEWNVLEDVNFFEGPNEVIELANRTHSSVTTPNHRWLVERERPWKQDYLTEWRTTEELRGRIRLPRIAPPQESGLGVRDQMAELVAWAWTEGHVARKKSYSISICQSHTANPGYVDRIRNCLTVCFPDGGWAEGRDERKGMTVFRLGVEPSRELVDLAIEVRGWGLPGDQDKIIKPEFLTALTLGQLNQFIETCVDADGTRGDATVFVQKRLDRIRSFEMACALAGRPTHTHRYTITTGPYAGWQGWHCTLLSTSHWTVQQMLNGKGEGFSERKTIEGEVWCPTVANGTWVARRDGAVYITGNSKGNDHTLDAATQMVLGWAQYSIEEFLTKPKEAPQPVFDAFVII